MLREPFGWQTYGCFVDSVMQRKWHTLVEVPPFLSQNLEFSIFPKNIWFESSTFWKKKICSVFVNRYLFITWLCCTTCGILIPWPGIEHMPPALEVWSLKPLDQQGSPMKWFTLNCNAAVIFPNQFLWDTHWGYFPIISVHKNHYHCWERKGTIRWIWGFCLFWERVVY